MERDADQRSNIFLYEDMLCHALGVPPGDERLQSQSEDP
jgi:hypothetical protein